MDLGNAARLTLIFRGYPDINRDYRVAADGYLSVPVIGRVKVSGKSASELEKELARRMTEITGNPAYVTVEVADYKPVFATGYVSKSEAWAWQPGMTVLKAVAMAGGIYRAADPVRGVNALVAETERTRVLRVTAELKAAFATRARLNAERQQLKSIEVPPELVALVGQTEADDLIRAQTVLLQSRRTAYNNQLAALQRGTSLGKQELDSLKVQNLRVDALLAARRAYQGKIKELQGRGIVTASRGFDEEIRVAELEEKTVNIAVATARVQATIGASDRDMLKLQLEGRANIESEIIKNQHDIEQLRIELASAKASYTKLTGEIALPVSRDRQMVITFSIVRKHGDVTSTLEAQQSTPLRPGDVLIVTAQEPK